MDLNVSDILLIFHNYEPSRVKLWEIVRRYDPIQVAALIYILENVTVIKAKEPVTLSTEELHTQCGGLMTIYDQKFAINRAPNIRTERVVTNHDTLFAIDSPHFMSVHRRRPATLFENQNVKELIMLIRSGNEITQMPNVYTKMVLHNVGTRLYNQFVANVVHLLFTAPLQGNRSEALANNTSCSVAEKYLHFYKIITGRSQLSDPRQVRFAFVPRHHRIYEKPTDLVPNYHVQPLYEGLRLIVNTTGSPSKQFFNQYGELLNGFLALTNMENIDATFEAIVVPTDKNNYPRSWRYWHFRDNFIMYIVDVFRFKQTVLFAMPFRERQQYIKLIPNVSFTAKEQALQQTLTTWDAIQHLCQQRNDLYESIVGIVLRKNDSLISEPTYEFRFPLTVCYNLSTEKLLALNAENLKTFDPKRLHFNNDMADWRTTAIAYAHNSAEYYLCAYNWTIHQFQHTGTLERLLYDIGDPRYLSAERLVVLGNKALPMGVLYIRIYYDFNHKIIGYDTKNTTGKYTLPFINDLYPK